MQYNANKKEVSIELQIQDQEVGSEEKSELFEKRFKNKTMEIQYGF